MQIFRKRVGVETPERMSWNGMGGHGPPTQKNGFWILAPALREMLRFWYYLRHKILEIEHLFSLLGILQRG